MNKSSAPALGDRARPAAPSVDKALHPPKSKPRVNEGQLFGVIEIGSSGLRMVVAQFDRAEDSPLNSQALPFRILDRAGKTSRIGRDVFTTGSISREGLRECLSILASFCELMQGYGIATRDIHVIATSALREATNRDTFLDRVKLQLGLTIEILEDIEENQLMFLAVQHALDDEAHYLSKGDSFILEVGGGSTEIMLLKNGAMTAAHAVRIGIIRVEEQVRSAGYSTNFLNQLLEDIVRTTCDHLQAEMDLAQVRSFIVVGSDVRLAATLLANLDEASRQNTKIKKAGKKTTEKKTISEAKSEPRPISQLQVEQCDRYSRIERATFIGFAEKVLAMTVEERVAKFRIPWAEAESLGAGLSIELLFLKRTGAEVVVIPNISLRDGLLLREGGLGSSKLAADALRDQVVAGALALGLRFHYDEPHARHVAKLACTFFDLLVREHGLGAHERLLLELASILHDVGTYIRSSGHHKHGEYLVANSELFGLNGVDHAIVANLVRYHRRSQPSNNHPNFAALPHEARSVVRKLAAILRLADALDRGHDQHVSTIQILRRGDQLHIRVSDTIDLSLERLSLAEKGPMFEEVFGLEPILI